MDALSQIAHYWHYLVAALTLLIAVLASGEVVLYKRDSRAAVLWLGVIWLLPVLGALLYLMLGINRIRRHARSLRGTLERHTADPNAPACPPESLPNILGAPGAHLNALAALVGNVVARPLVSGNRIEPLRNGDVAYPLMLEAIRQATRSISFMTYIFDNDAAGREFVQAFGDAVKRGVAVRVLIDDMGVRYSWPSVVRGLRQVNVPVARFLPTLVPWHSGVLNLRNHRKIMVVDGQVGFTGGMNIRVGNRLKINPAHPVQDLHFRVQGPVLTHLQEAFVDDWFFSTGEALRGEPWFGIQTACGPVIARGISDGPDEDFDKLRWTLLGALASAQSSIHIVTPYFLPDPALISALNLAAMRGVTVHIILPSVNNLPFVQWATNAMLWQVLERGCHVWMTPPPFDHSKLMLVDNLWTLLGSANWDPRSLRLNFEFNLECYDRDLGLALAQLVREKMARARPLTLEQVDNRRLPVRLRDGVARLLTPFL